MRKSPNNRGDPDYQTIVEDMVDGHLEAVVHRYLPGAKRSGREIKGNCDGVVRVVMSGAKRGLVAFHQGQGPGKAQNGGNLIHLIQLSEGCSHGQAVEIAKRDYLGIDGGNHRPDPEQQKRKAEERQARQQKAAAEADREKKLKTQNARQLWSRGVDISGTLGEQYLKGRGITLPALPPSLRFIRDYWHPWTSQTVPAIVAPVQSVDGALMGVKLICLTTAGEKLPSDQSKPNIGPVGGGAVRLGQIKGPRLLLCEGIETGLAIMCLTRSSAPVWACLSAQGILQAEIPQSIKNVVIYADGDPWKEANGRLVEPTGRACAERKAGLLREAGLTAHVEEPPAGSDFLDVWNTVKESITA